MSWRSIVSCIAASALSVSATTAFAAEPVVSVWYRGNPAGTPRQGDIGAIRALGFNGVTWPRGDEKSLVELQRLAAAVGLKVIVSDVPVPLTAQSALTPSDRVDIVVDAETAP